MSRAHASALLFLLLFFGALPASSQPVLRWGGDSEGGAPFVEADPNDPLGIFTHYDEPGAKATRLARLRVRLPIHDIRALKFRK